MRTQRSGFTLIELLVVIAIIAILAAILFPVFMQAKRAAMLTTCTSNMRQFAVAIELYRENYQGNMPQAKNIEWPHDFEGCWYDASGIPTRWNYYEQLAKYMKSNSVAICPATPIKHAKQMLSLPGALWINLDGTRSKWYGAVYATTAYDWEKDPARLGGYLPSGFAQNFNAEMRWSQGGGPGLRNPDNFDFDGIMRARRSQTVILLCMSGTWMSFPESPGRPPDQVWRGNHDRGTPCLFADMHVKFCDYRTVGLL